MSELRVVVGQVLEGWTLPDDVRKILEAAYYAAPAAQTHPDLVLIKRSLLGAVFAEIEALGKLRNELRDAAIGVEKPIREPGYDIHGDRLG